jgi:hypothetical protein
MKLTTERLNMCIILRNHETALISLNPPMPSQFSCASYARWRKTCAALCHAYRQWPMANGPGFPSNYGKILPFSKINKDDATINPFLRPYSQSQRLAVREGSVPQREG